MRQNHCNTRKNTNSLETFFDEFLGGLEGVFGRDMNPTGHSIPHVNIVEEEASFKIEVAAPGWSKSDFKIHLEKNNLTIETREEAKASEDLDGKYHRREFRHGSLKRSFTLPENVDKDNISARYLNGILHVTLPKFKKEEITREVSIS